MARQRRSAKRKPARSPARSSDLPVKRKKAAKVKGGGDEVLLSFQAGTPRSAVVLGSLWKSSDRPPTSRTS